MRLTHDLFTGISTRFSGDDESWIGRSRDEDLIVDLRNNSAAYELGVDESLVLKVKPKGYRNGDPLFEVEILPADYNDDLGAYRVSFESDTAAVRTLLSTALGAANKVSSKHCDGDISFFTSPTDDPRRGHPFDVLLINSVSSEDDGPPVTTSIGAAGWLRNPGWFTAYLGSLATSVDGQPTVDVLSTGTCIATAISGDFAIWQLQAGTAAENVSGGIIRPDDYNASTNARIWVRIS